MVSDVEHLVLERYPTQFVFFIVVMLLQELLWFATEGNIVLLLIDMDVDMCFLQEWIQQSACNILLQERL